MRSVALKQTVLVVGAGVLAVGYLLSRQTQLIEGQQAERRVEEAVARVASIQALGGVLGPQ
jgi:hypothetical protein